MLSPEGLPTATRTMDKRERMPVYRTAICWCLTLLMLLACGTAKGEIYYLPFTYEEALHPADVAVLRAVKDELNLDLGFLGKHVPDDGGGGFSQGHPGIDFSEMDDYLIYDAEGVPVEHRVRPTARVINLFLESKGLTGSIPPELGSFAFLEALHIGDNSFSGSIPPELGNLKRLAHLTIFNNQLTGSIPAELGGLIRLRSLDLSGNLLSGAIPGELGQLTELFALHLYDNLLTGEIPPELGELADLIWLELQDNELEGPIPSGLGDLTQLDVLNLQNNLLEGEIPAELGDLVNLVDLSLESNLLEGEIPAELGNLTNLATLNLGYNSLEGEIPSSLGNLTNLIELALYNNGLTGAIPAALGNLALLEHLGLDSNRLTGPIPPQLGNLEQLVGLALEANELSGPIPPQLGMLENLEYLVLSENHLNGKIPASLGNLENLVVVDLTDNRITGSLPVAWLDLASLEEVYLSLNHFSTAPDSVIVSQVEALVDAGVDVEFLPQWPEIIDQSLAAKVEPGSWVELSVTALGAELTYQWYQGTSGNTLGKIPGAEGSTYTYHSSYAPGVYWCRVTAGENHADSGTIVIQPVYPEIVTQPQDVNVQVGDSAALQVVAEGYELKYQWYAGASGDTSAPVPGATGPSYTVTGDPLKGRYWVRVTGKVIWNDSRTARVRVPGGPTDFDLWAQDSHLNGADAAPMATPHKDGVPNLLKFAFNMDASRADVRQLTAGGNGAQGLPGSRLVGTGAAQRLQIEYLRRRQSDIEYVPLFSTNAKDWIPATSVVVTETIDDEWERVVATGSMQAAKNFARVMVRPD